MSDITFLSLFVLTYIYLPIVGMEVNHNDTHALSRTPLDEVSARRRDHCLVAHNTYTIQTSVPTAGFKLAIPGSERPQTHLLRPRGHRNGQLKL